MIKLDLNKNIVNLTGEEIENNSLGKLLAGALVSGSKGDAIKFYDWAQRLYKGEVVEIDNSDFIILEKFVNNNEQFTILAKAQILKEMQAQKFNQEQKK